NHQLWRSAAERAHSQAKVATLAATNKCLAPSNKSCEGGKASKKRQFRQPKEARKMSLITISILVTFLLAPAHAGSRFLKDAQDDIKAFRNDTGTSTSRSETTGPQSQPEPKPEPPALSGL